MKALFYYLFGILSVLLCEIHIFNSYADIYLDDYYIELLYNVYPTQLIYINTIVSVLWSIFAIIFVFMLGRGTNHEKREPLLIKKEERQDRGEETYE